MRQIFGRVRQYAQVAGWPGTDAFPGLLSLVERPGGGRRVAAMVVAFAIGSSIAVAPAVAVKAEPLRIGQPQKLMIFAPVYGAVSKGYFKQRGLAPEITTIVGVAGVAAALLRGTIDIGLTGPEVALFSAGLKMDERIRIIGALSNKDGQFLLSRIAPGQEEAGKVFSWKQLLGKTVLGWRRSNTPGYMFEAALRAKGIDPVSQIKLISHHLSPRLYHEAWRGKEADFAPFYEPAASWYERTGHGKIVASVGQSLGPSVYTVVLARAKTIREQPEFLQRAVSGLQESLSWIHRSKAADVSGVIKPYLFRGAPEDIERAVTRYRSIRFWNSDLRISHDAMKKVQDMLVSTGASRPSFKIRFDNIIEPGFAEHAYRQVTGKK